MLTSGRALKLRLDDLLDAVGAYFNYTFIVNFAGARYAQYMLAGNN